MRVVGFTEFGGPDVLGVHQVPEPHAGPGQVRIRVHAAAINPADTVFRVGALRPRMVPALRPPYVPGMDVAGVIDEVGDGVRWTVGDRVLGILVPYLESGAYAEHVVLDARSVARVPGSASLAEAATLPMNGLTARQALDRLRLPPGATVLITGGAGATGGYAVQLARAEGLRVIADATPRDEELLRRLGADEVVPRGAGMVDAVLARVPDGVAGVVDAAVIGGPVARTVRAGGGIAAVRDFDGTPPSGVTVHRVSVATYATEQDKLAELGKLAEAGTLSLRVADVLPYSAAPAAHRRLEAGGTRGRLVLNFAADPSS